MQNKEPQASNFSALVDAIVNASLGGHPVAKEQIGQLGSTPLLLQSFGLPDLPLGLKGKVIEKIVMDHGIPKSMVKRLSAPQAVYASAPPHPSGVIVLTFEVTGLGQVMLSVASAQSVGRSQTMNLVTSVYAKEDARAFARWEADGLLLWRAKTAQP